MSSTAPPDPFHLVLDETLSGPSIFDALRREGFSVLKLTDVAPRGTSDEDLLCNLAGRPAHYLLTRDRDFKYKPSVRRALRDGSVGAFVITAAGNKSAAVIVEIVSKAWPRVRRYLLKKKPPFVARITGDGQVADY